MPCPSNTRAPRGAGVPALMLPPCVLLQMNRPIQVKPADSESRGGSSCLRQPPSREGPLVSAPPFPPLPPPAPHHGRGLQRLPAAASGPLGTSWLGLGMGLWSPGWLVWRQTEEESGLGSAFCWGSCLSESQWARCPGHFTAPFKTPPCQEGEPHCDGTGLAERAPGWEGGNVLQSFPSLPRWCPW